MRASALFKASWRKPTTWFLAGIALGALPEACSAERPAPSASESDPSPAAAIIDARPRLDAIRRRFPVVFDPPESSDVRLERSSSGGFRAASSSASAPRSATVELPAKARGAVRLTDEGSRMSLGFTLEGAEGSPIAIDGSVALYEGAAPSGGDVVHRTSASGTEDLVIFEKAPAREELRYLVDVSGVAGLRLVAGTLEFLDPGGVPRLRVEPPYVVDAEGARREASLSVDGCSFDASPRAPFGRAVTPPGAASCTVQVSWQGARVRYPAIVDPVWASTTNTMTAARTRHTMTLLNPTEAKSLVLVAGGFTATGGVALKTAELYDPLSRRFTATGSMTVARGAHSATLLTTVVQPPQFTPAQPVLVAGGADSANTPLASLEVYDPVSGTFVVDPNTMTANPGFEHTGTLYADNAVLLAGGITLPLNQPTNTAYAYSFTGFVGSPPTGVTSSLAFLPSTMSSSRTALASVLLPGGQVLLTGGFVLAGGALQALQTAELFDPANNTFGPIQTSGGGLANMSVQRGYHTATVLATGRVLVVGGLSKTTGGIYTNTVDFYSDGTGGVKGFVSQVVPVTMITGRANHTATLLTTGSVLVAGGFTTGGSSTSSVEVYSPASNAFSVLAALAPMAARGDHTAVLVNAGDAVTAGRSVLVAGGASSFTPGAGAILNAQILLKINGDVCTQDDECLSGHCTNATPNAGKICCDTACTEVCRACSAAGKGSGADGTCGNASNTTELGWKCVSKVGQEVEILQGCDGTGNVIPFETNKCPPNKCNGDRCGTDCPCSDAGFCTDAAVPEEDGGAGGGGGGGGSDGGPSSGVHCDNRKDKGIACGEGRECHSGFCVDGYCCESACTGQCEACDIPGNVGFCRPVGTPTSPEAPHTQGASIDFNGVATKRDVCAGAGTGCSGFCRGVSGACEYPGSLPNNQITPRPPACATQDDGTAEVTNYTCDGLGGEVATPSSCVGFKCEEDTSGGADAGVLCKATCDADDDCIQDYVCLPNDAGQNLCQKLTGPLCDGKFTLRRPIGEGGNVECLDHYTCPAGSTSCLKNCESVSDCVSPYVCNSKKVCVKEPNAPELSSCSAAVTGLGSTPAPGRVAGWLVAALAGLAIGRAHRRRQRRSASK